MTLPEVLEQEADGAPSKRFYTVPEAADLLGVGPYAVYSAIRQGQLAAIRVGSKLRLPALQFERLARLEPVQSA